MKATWIIFTVLVLGTSTAFAQNTDSLTFSLRNSDWCYSKKANMYGAKFCDEKITENIIVYYNGKALPYREGNVYYAASIAKGEIYVGIKMKDGSKPPVPVENRTYQVVIIGK
jgi:hypothetical protein